jgi:hypothetical protein
MMVRDAIQRALAEISYFRQESPSRLAVRPAGSAPVSDFTDIVQQAPDDDVYHAVCHFQFSLSLHQGYERALERFIVVVSYFTKKNGFAQRPIPDKLEK